jgi:hypothetical protein
MFTETITVGDSPPDTIDHIDISHTTVLFSGHNRRVSEALISRRRLSLGLVHRAADGEPEREAGEQSRGREETEDRRRLEMPRHRVRDQDEDEGPKGGEAHKAHEAHEEEVEEGAGTLHAREGEVSDAYSQHLKARSRNHLAQ